MLSNNLKNCLILSITPYFGYKRFLYAVKKNINIDEFIANPLRYESELKLRQETLIFLQNKKYSQYLDKAINWINQDNNNIICYFDENYPENLKYIPTPPLILYAIGNIKLLKSLQIAVIGARKNTIYGKNATNKLVKDLCQNNITITSGLAYGIDTLAHKATLENNGKTIAVIGTGIDIIYPSINKILTKNITEKGLLISEFPFGTKPLKHNFPQRNRVISGLSKATLVIEAAQKSGSLITAKYALEQNKDVFAVPGSIFNEYSIGCNDLIQQGAKLISNVEDILEELNIQTDELILNEKNIDIPKHLQHLYSFINYEMVTIDYLINKTNIDYVKINQMLFELQMKDAIESIAGGYIRK